jgi:phosphoribosyl 1,2-cyclic phosphodiesterase
MTRFSDRQSQIEHRRRQASEAYPQIWHQIIEEWNSTDQSDRAWLMYSANYLLRTGGVRWALDPLTLRRRLPSAPAVDASALSAADFIVLTHRHADHLDPDLLRSLCDYSLRWVVPAPMLSQVWDEVGIQEKDILVPEPLKPFELHGIYFTPFEAFHWSADPSRPEGRRGVPEIGYLAEFCGKRWLFPGDTRTYDADLLPRFGGVDGLVAHLWLGRQRGLQEDEAMIESFCRFCLNLQPGRIVLTHLEELGRDARDYWDEGHAERVVQRFCQLAPSLEVTFARMGDSFQL